MKTKKGFTLLEILVVIGIIAILVAMAAASYSTAQKKARDAKRKGDLSAMQKYLEQCYAISSYAYPTGADLTGGATTSITATCDADSTSLTITDPSSKTYNLSNSTSTTYTISNPLEDSTSFIITQQQ